MKRGVMNVTRVTLGVAFLAALGTWLLLRPQGTGSQTVLATVESAASDIDQASALEATLTSLKEEITTLKQAHDRLAQSFRATEAVLTRPTPASAQTGTAADAAEGEVAPQAESERRSEGKKIMEMLSALDLRLGREPDDPTWSKRTKIDIATLLHGEGMEGSRVLCTDCQSTVCRIEVEHEDVSAQGQFTDHLPMEPPFDGEMVLHRVDDGLSAPRTLIYVARQGQPLLDVDY